MLDSRANGVGPKTAARIVLELKDKLKGAAFAADADGDTSGAVPDVSTAAPDKLSDAENALIVLGYSRAEAYAALRKIDTANLEVDDIIRLALKQLMR